MGVLRFANQIIPFAKNSKLTVFIKVHSNKKIMKNLNKILVITMVALAASNSYGQLVSIKAGINSAKFHIEEDPDFEGSDVKSKLGPQMGVALEFPLTKQFSFETGLMYSSKGFKMKEEITDMGMTYSLKYKVNVSYFEIPLTAKAFFKVGDAKIYGVFGPYLGLAINGIIKMEMEFMDVKETDSDALIIGDDISPLDIGLTIGTGVEFNRFQFGLNYGMGLNNVFLDSDDNQNRVFSFSVGFRLNNIK